MGSADFIHNRQEFTGGPLTLDEMIKILSVLENPPEAANIRKALRFYQAPEVAEYKWGKLDELMRSLKKYETPVSKDVLDLVKKAKAVLVIGSGFGGVLKSIASVMDKGSLIVAVERDDFDAPAFLNAKSSLKETCRQLCMLGARVELFLGDSHAQKLVQAVEGYAPFDFVLVNGDDKDAENYAPMAYVMGRVKDSGIGIIYRE